MNYKASLLLLGLLFAVVLSLSSAAQTTKDEQNLAAAEEINQGGYGGRCRWGCCAYRGYQCARCCGSREEASLEPKQLNNDQEANYVDDEVQPDRYGGGYGGGRGGYGGGWGGGRGGGGWGGGRGGRGWGGGRGRGGGGWGGGGGGGGQEDSTETKPQN